MTPAQKVVSLKKVSCLRLRLRLCSVVTEPEPTGVGQFVASRLSFGKACAVASWPIRLHRLQQTAIARNEKSKLLSRSSRAVAQLTFFYFLAWLLTSRPNCSISRRALGACSYLRSRTGKTTKAEYSEADASAVGWLLLWGALPPCFPLSRNAGVYQRVCSRWRPPL